MNPDIFNTEKYPSVGLQQPAGDNSHPGHIGNNQWASNNDVPAAHLPSPQRTPFFNAVNNDCAYPQQQRYPDRWNNWATEQNNNAPTYNVPETTASTLNPQADPWHWNTGEEPQQQVNYYANTNQDPLVGGPEVRGWDYMDPQVPTYGGQQPWHQPQQLPNEDVRWQQKPPNDTTQWKQPPIEGTQWQQPPNEGAHWQQPPNEGTQYHQQPASVDPLWQQPPLGQQQPAIEDTQWQQQQHHEETNHWPSQQQGEIAVSPPELVLKQAVDTTRLPIYELSNQLEECHLSQPLAEEQNHFVAEAKEEVPSSYQQLEKVEEISHHPIPPDPPLIFPRKGSLFQPPQPSSASLLSYPPPPPPLASSHVTSPSPENDATIQDPIPQLESTEATSDPLPEPISAVEVKQEVEEVFRSDDAHVPEEPLLPAQLLEWTPEKQKGDAEGSSPAAARPHPLHLSLHRQHFSNDVHADACTTLWENPPMNSIPNVTLMPFAKTPLTEVPPLKMEDSESTVEEPPPTSVQDARETSPPRQSPAPPVVTSPAPPVVTSLAEPVIQPSVMDTAHQNVPSVDPPSPTATFHSDSARSSTTSSALPSPERRRPVSPSTSFSSSPRHPPLHQHRDSSFRQSNSSLSEGHGSRTRLETRSPEQSNNQLARPTRDGEDPSHHTFSEHSPGHRSSFRPEHYPVAPGNYSSRPSSRASEPPTDSYRRDSYGRERTPSRMSEVTDDRIHKGDYGRAYDNRGYDEPRYKDYENRRNSYDWRYEDRQGYGHRSRDYPNGGYEDSRGRDYADRQRRDYVDPGSVKGSQESVGKQSYSDRDYHNYGREHRVDPGGGMGSQENVSKHNYTDRDYQRYSRDNYDQHYSRSRHEQDYYNRPGAPKGYDYYGWNDPYRLYYQQYYSNYAAANAYGARNNYGYHKERYETDPKYRQQVDDYMTAYRQSQLGYESDHHSIHSGRSSVTEELRKDGMDLNRDSLEQNHDSLDSSVMDSISQPTPPPRMTPVKFSCVHPICRLHPGRVISIIPSHSMSVVASVNIYDVQHAFQFDPGFKEVKDFPGPLICGQTHKKDVMAFCQQKVSQLQNGSSQTSQVVDRSSQILLLELLILLIRQNGNVIGSDIAELLLKDMQSGSSAQTPTSSIHTSGTSPLEPLGGSSSSSNDNPDLLHAVEGSPSSTPSPDEGIVVSQDRTLVNKELSVHQVTQKFTDYLLYGNKKDGLEWAIRHNLWGHALFLAYRMGSNSHANMMTRFANSLPRNDPLQTLYQHMSGRQPASVTSVSDEKWGDWRPHLAMILSNPTANPLVDQRSIVTLGNTLAQKGCLSAAHFCYLMAQLELGTYDNKSSKMVLLGADNMLPFSEFATNEAIQLTEVYEYAMSLANSNYMQPNFQPYKFLYATRLADYGQIREALLYCEFMATTAVKLPGYISLSLFKQIESLGSRLKYNDPHYMEGAGELEELGDPPWLTQLQQMINHLASGMPAPSPNLHTTNQENQVEGSMYTESQLQYSYQQQQQQATNTTEEVGTIPSQPDSVPMINAPPNEGWPPQAYNSFNSPYSYPGTQGVPEMGNLQDPEQSYNQQEAEQVGEQAPISATTNSYWDNVGLSTNYGSQAAPLSPSLYGSSQSRQRQDSVNSTNSRKGSNASNTMAHSGFSGLGSATHREEGGQSFQQPAQGNKLPSSQQQAKADVAIKQQAGRSWLGNIFNRLLPKGPNQMILPDDKTPRIVWDEKTKSWVDMDGNSEDQANANLPPPKDSELMPPASPLIGGNISQTGPPSGGDMNRYQRQKQRGMRGNYVDILNSNNTNRGTLGSSESLFPKMESIQATPTLFVPPSITDNAYDPQTMNSNENLPPTMNTLKHEQDANFTPLLNTADFNITANNQNTETTRKPPISRLGGRRSYPS